jgi:glycosyltransferase involved in cell wall biosynthesis
MGVEDRFSTVLPGWEPLLRHYRSLAPAFPALVRARRLPEADVLLTSSYAFAHGFSTENRAPQVCYCYSPFRFAWSMTESYAEELARGRLAGEALRALAALMRAMDRRAARRVTRYLAESKFVADQIERFYGRRAEVIWPPVDCELFRPAPDTTHDGYFLLCGRLIEPYKRPSLVIEAFRSLPERLLVAGDGPALPRLREHAGSNVEFLGHLDDDQLVPVMQRCAAAIFPSRDDFGLIPAEVMACGRPVLAYAAGGALETILPGRTGELFHEQAPDALAEAVRAFDPDAYDPAVIRAHAKRFRRERFRDAIVAAVREVARTGPDGLS